MSKLSLLLLCTLLCGCTSFHFSKNKQSQFEIDCKGVPLEYLLDASELKKLFDTIAAEFCRDTCMAKRILGSTPPKPDSVCPAQDDSGYGTVIVTDFADILSLQPDKAGLLMGELMRSSLNSVCNYRILQAEFAKYFKLSENGNVVLTRKASEIKSDTFSEREAVVGTYQHINNKLLIFARAIEIKTGVISNMVTKEVNYSCKDRKLIQYSIK